MSGEQRVSGKAKKKPEQDNAPNQLQHIREVIDKNQISPHKKIQKNPSIFETQTHKKNSHAIYFVRKKPTTNNRKRSNSTYSQLKTNALMPKIVTQNLDRITDYKNQKQNTSTKKSAKKAQQKPKKISKKTTKKVPQHASNPKQKIIHYYKGVKTPIDDYRKKQDTPAKEKPQKSQDAPKEIVEKRYQKNKQILVSYKNKHHTPKKKKITKKPQRTQNKPQRQARGYITKLRNPKKEYKNSPQQQENKETVEEKGNQQIKKIIRGRYQTQKNNITNYKNRHQKEKQAKPPRRKIKIKFKRQKNPKIQHSNKPKQIIQKQLQTHKSTFISNIEKHRAINQKRKHEKLQKQASKKLYKQKAKQSELSEKIIDDFEYGKKNGIFIKNKLRREQQKKTDLLKKQQTTQPKIISNPDSNKLITITPETLQEIKRAALKREGYHTNVYEEVDFYPLQEPFSYIIIVNHTLNNEKHYVIVEAELSEEENTHYQFLKDTLSYIDIDSEQFELEGQNNFLLKKINNILEEYKIELADSSKQKIIYYLKKDLLGLAIIEPIMQDKNIEDVSCDGVNIPIFVYHRTYGSIQTNLIFDDEEDLSSFVVKLAQKCGKHISIADPMLDATMPDGSRIQMTLSTEVTAKGSTFTIRKFKEDPFTSSDLIEFNTMNNEMIAYLWLAVEHGVNAIVAGGTAAGKTSTLNALSLFIPRDSKIVSIEETRELNLPHPNWIPGVARTGFGEKIQGKTVGEIDLFDLMKAALRQRPEYLLVGEIRGREAYVLFQAMATGHTTYSTVHADSAQGLIHRLEGKPINIPRIMLQSLDIICIQVISRVNNKRARRCKQIIEIVDIDPTTKEILTNEAFRWDPVKDTFMFTGKSFVLEKIRAKKGLSREEMIKELQQRAEVLLWMKKHNIRVFNEVATTITQYIEDPTGFVQKMK